MSGALDLVMLGVPGIGGGAFLPFSDTFTRADGDLANGWLYSAGVWTISSGAVVATPSLGAELVANGTMETGDPPTSWGARNGSTLSSVADERTGGAGSASINVVRGTANSAARQQIVNPVHQYLQVTAWVKRVSGVSAGTTLIWRYSTSVAWAEITGAFRDTTAARTFDLLVTDTSGNEARFDDISIKPVVWADALALRDFKTPNVKASANVTSEYTAAGLVLCADSITAPTNFILIELSRDVTFAQDVLHVEKCVNGVMTRLVSKPFIDASAGHQIRAEYYGHVLRIWYQGLVWSSDLLIDDASIINNTLHGVFSAHPDARLDNYAAVAAAAPVPINGVDDAMFSVTSAAANLWTASGTDDWLGRAVLVDDGAKWIAIYRSGVDHNSPGGVFHVRYSVDEGANWLTEDTWTDDSTPVTGAPFTAEGTHGNLSDAIIMQAPNGDLLVQAFNSNTGGGDGSVVGTRQWRSTDDGATFVAEGLINSDNTLIGGQDYTIVGSDIYITIMYDEGGDLANPWLGQVFKSSDNGTTWVLRGTFEPTLTSEPGIQWVGGTRLVVVARDENDAVTWGYVSDDLGATWSDPQTLTTLGILQRPRIKAYAGGYLLYGRNSRDPYTNYQDTVLYYSVDGIAWGKGITLDTGFGDASYCDVLQRVDGSFYMLTYGGASTTAAAVRELSFAIV